MILSFMTATNDNHHDDDDDDGYDKNVANPVPLPTSGGLLRLDILSGNDTTPAKSPQSGHAMIAMMLSPPMMMV